MAPLSSAAQDLDGQVAPPDGWVRVDGRLVPSSYLAEEAVRTLLAWIEEDPTRDGLRDTPGRVLRALKEMTGGMSQNPADILGTVFEVAYDEVVIVKGIPFTSLCEHHMLPFVGEVNIGYLPGVKGVVGLSKLARLVDCSSRRLQVQERMTRQIADAIAECLGALGVAVVVRASHSCMSCRGVRKQAEMVTSVMLGVFRDKVEARMEFLELCRR